MQIKSLENAKYGKQNNQHKYLLPEIMPSSKYAATMQTTILDNRPQNWRQQEQATCNIMLFYHAFDAHFAPLYSEYLVSPFFVTNFWYIIYNVNIVHLLSFSYHISLWENGSHWKCARKLYRCSVSLVSMHFICWLPSKLFIVSAIHGNCPSETVRIIFKIELKKLLGNASMSKQPSMWTHTYSVFVAYC